MVEIVFFDTCALLEMREITRLYDNPDFRLIMGEFKWGLTEELREEYCNYKLDEFFHLKEGYLVPISAVKKGKFISNFVLESIDKADQDLLFLSNQDKSIIISNDSDVMIPAESLGLNAFFFWEFCIHLVKINLLSKKEYQKCWKYWEQRKRYTKARLKKMKTAINFIK
ncbi:MAG: hypothetical protein ACTSYU_06835 [Promethearchaeota archaeon]